MDILSKSVKVKIPIGKSCESEEYFFDHLIKKELRKKYGILDSNILARIQKEEEVIKKKKLTGYFLAVWDIINFAKERQIFTMVTRDSAGGSLINYALNITCIDPLKYGLIFEIFLNRHKNNKPIIKLDVPVSRFEEIQDYIVKHHGIRERPFNKSLKIEISGSFKCELFQHLSYKSLRNIPLDDKETFEMLNSYKPEDILMFESRQARDWFRKVHPQTIKELIMFNAFRHLEIEPGFDPLSNIKVEMDIIEEELYRGDEKKLLDSILEETDGLLFFQEQIIKILNSFGGLTLPESDFIRRSMSVKDKEKRNKYKAGFLNRASKNNFGYHSAKVIWNAMELLATEIPLKAHCAGESLTDYYLAYFKTHHPKDFDESFLSAEKEGVF